MGSNIAQSLAGLSQAERAEAKNKKPAPRAAEVRGRKDEADLVVVNTETAEAVRGLKSNDQEEAQEDRQQQPPYTPTGQVKPGGNAPHIDLNG